jgi:uncharacterized membrane-anchored protein YitT (DUF2179 family)
MKNKTALEVLEYWIERFYEVNGTPTLDEIKEQINLLKENEEASKYLILSGEGDYKTENQFCMELNTLDVANEHFDNLKKGEYKDTYLYIYEAKLIREE